ncbi:MAG: endonuclease/exonuclease/phosphatase family protein [Labilithrix sp.]|nr:endonuclease/exonuclease/phosphatase family protein [Labilithrix sp.]
MWRALASGLLVVAISACDDQKVATPSVPPTPTARDSGAAPEGWGDPTTTRRPGVLRLGHLNVRRYFDTTCDSGRCNTGDFEDVATEAAFEARTAELASGLSRLEADVITLAEVENQGCLDALQAKLKAAGFDYPVAHLADIGVAGSVNVGVLSRGKLETVKTYRKETPLTREDGSKTVFTRELPEVHLTLGSNSVIAYAAHFRSKAEDDPGRRIAEAKATRDIMMAAATANTGAVVLLGGDLNDVPGSDTINAMEEGGALVRVAKDLPEASQGTYTFGGQRQAIDHIFTTASRATAYVPKSATILRDGNSGFAGSDHASIYADFKLP